MRIDPNQFVPSVQSEGVQQTNTRGTQPTQSQNASDAAGVDAEDQFQPSSTLDQVQRLKAQLAEMPEVRNDRVSALSQKIREGSYKPSNDQIAGSMISDMGRSKRS